MFDTSLSSCYSYMLRFSFFPQFKCYFSLVLRMVMYDKRPFVTYKMSGHVINFQ